MESRPPLWVGFGKNLHGYTRKGVWGFVGYLLHICELQLLRDWSCGLKARSDTFQAADRLEKNGGIYWLWHADMGGREDSILFSVSVCLFSPFSLHLNLIFLFLFCLPCRPNAKVCKYPFFPKNSCLPLRSTASRTRPSRLGTSPCALFLLRMHDA